MRGAGFEARFRTRVDKSGECWTWLGSIHRDGYGVMWADREARERFGLGSFNVRAHRAAWLIEHGPIPAGKVVCHRCDNPRCVRPSHLWLGTPRENTRDAAAKGRLAKPNAKISAHDVRIIRRRFAAGERSSDIAIDFGISRDQVTNIGAGRSWKSVEGAPGPRLTVFGDRRGEANSNFRHGRYCGASR